MPDKPSFILTKIIATVGPACAEPTTLAKMVDHGARVFRINFSHGSFDSLAELLSAIRKASETTGIPVGVLGDLCGPKIRTGKVQGSGVTLEPGTAVHIQEESVVTASPSDSDQPVVFSTTYPSCLQDVQVGDRLLIDDGSVRLLVVDKQLENGQHLLICRVTTGGLVTSSKGINLPDTNVTVPALTDHDYKCVEWALKNDLDYLALSFVRRAQDVRQLNELLQGDSNKPTKRLTVIAKIEKPQALDELDAIVQEADGIMVARGDLGVEMDLARVPMAQKRIIALAHDYGKPVIVATQMLQSMIELPTPTRAEVSDVANAIFDGADAVMLSGETAVGNHPIEAVRMMGWIAQVSQEDMAGSQNQPTRPPARLQEGRYRTAALAHGVNVVVRDMDAKMMAIWSQKGGGARYLSQNRPAIPIIAASSDPAVLRRMCIMFAVTPVLMERPSSFTHFITGVSEMILGSEWAEKGDSIVVVGGEPIGTQGVTNTVSIHRLGDQL